MSSKRFSKDDWAALGLRQLRAEGPRGLALAAVCGAAGRTRGSFYHHFEDHDAFVLAVMAAWRDLNATAAQDAHAGDDDAGGRQGGDAATVFARLTAQIDHELDRSARQIAQSRPEAAEIVRAVDALRVAALATLYRRLFDGDAAAADRVAAIDYAAYVGAQTLWPERETEEMRALGETFLEMAQALAQGRVDQRPSATAP